MDGCLGNMREREEGERKLEIREWLKYENWMTWGELEV